MESKIDLATSIITAVIGVLISYFVCGFFLGEGSSVDVKTVSSTVSSSLAEPNVDIFNYKALNPTVETYVGECQEYDENGNCIDDALSGQSQEVIEEIIENGPIEEGPVEGPAQETE